MWHPPGSHRRKITSFAVLALTAVIVPPGTNKEKKGMYVENDKKKQENAKKEESNATEERKNQKEKKGKEIRDLWGRAYYRNILYSSTSIVRRRRQRRARRKKKRMSNTTCTRLID